MRLRGAGLFALGGGAVGSVWLLLRAAEHPPPFLLVLFIGWVLSPFAALASGDAISRTWPPAARTALYVMMVVVAVVCLVAYATAGPEAARPKPRVFLFVVVPPASWALTAMVVGAAALSSRGGAHSARGHSRHTR